MLRWRTCTNLCRLFWARNGREDCPWLGLRQGGKIMNRIEFILHLEADEAIGRYLNEEDFLQKVFEEFKEEIDYIKYCETRDKL